jgi:hypothetical protein
MPPRVVLPLGIGFTLAAGMVASDAPCVREYAGEQPELAGSAGQGLSDPPSQPERLMCP